MKSHSFKLITHFWVCRTWALQMTLLEIGGIWSFHLLTVQAFLLKFHLCSPQNMDHQMHYLHIAIIKQLKRSTFRRTDLLNMMGTLYIPLSSFPIWFSFFASRSFAFNRRLSFRFSIQGHHLLTRSLLSWTQTKERERFLKSKTGQLTTSSHQFTTQAMPYLTITITMTCTSPKITPGDL